MMATTMMPDCRPRRIRFRNPAILFRRLLCCLCDRGLLVVVFSPNAAIPMCSSAKSPFAEMQCTTTKRRCTSANLSRKMTKGANIALVLPFCPIVARISFKFLVRFPSTTITCLAPIWLGSASISLRFQVHVSIIQTLGEDNHYHRPISALIQMNRGHRRTD